MEEQDYQDSLAQDEQRYEDKHIKRYKVVQPDLIDPDAPLGNQEPIDNDLRDLVNVNDDSDRFMASPDDFPDIGEIINEDDFELVDVNYVDDQGVGTADFAFRKEGSLSNPNK
jgi:hypothetical protein